jgi:hypothetical protein
VVVEVLDQRPAQGDVDDLLAAADAEDRQLPLARLLEEPQLGLVEVVVDGPDFLVLRLAVERRVDVPATGQQETVDVRQRGRAGRELDRLRARRLDRLPVRQVVRLAPEGADRDRDPWLFYLALAPAGAAWPTASSSASIFASSSAEPWTFGPLNQFLAERNQYPPEYSTTTATATIA